MATVEELQTQIKSLENQLRLLMKDLRIPLMVPQEEVKNYDYLLKEAETSFYEKKYLEAFLIQSCIVEGVLKKYASEKLLSVTSQSVVLKNKFENFEFARLIDELFISGKIKKDLYENLDAYRKKRNNIVHDLLEYEDKEKLDEELKKAYELGKNMKGFIVDDMRKEIKKGLTVTELKAQIAALLAQLSHLQSQLQLQSQLIKL